MKLFSSSTPKSEANSDAATSSSSGSTSDTTTTTTATADTTGSMLSSRMTSGPLGYGDPNDRTLRKVETEVMVPKIVRERAKTLKCTELKAEFDKCCIDNAMLMVFNCRDVNRRFQECMSTWFNDKDFVSECTDIYLAQRSEFRTTGIKANPKEMKLAEKLRKEQRQKEASAAAKAAATPT